MYLESVPARTITRMKKGQKFKTNDREGYLSRFVVLSVNPGIVVCRNLKNGFIESFDLGTLVTMGMEPEWDTNYDEEDPRGRYAV